MPADAALFTAWLSLFPGIIFAALGAFLRKRPARLERILAALPGPLPAQGEIRWLPRIFLMVGGAWLAVFFSQVFPYPHNQRPYFVPLLEILLVSLSAAAFLGTILWIAVARRFLIPEQPPRKD